MLRPYQRVLLLCAQNEVREACQLCLAGVADDYVQHWPIPLDGGRLRLSVQLLGRELALARAGLLREGDAFIHTTHLNDEAWQVIKDVGARVSMSPPLESRKSTATAAKMNATKIFHMT